MYQVFISDSNLYLRFCKNISLLAAFDTLQAPIPHITVFYICIHNLITFVTLLHLITPQCPIASEFIREQSHFIAI